MVSGGSEPAFAAIYERHHQALYRYCRSILGDSDDAGDALQTTMLNAFRALNTSEKDVALRPWLFRIAHNESISLARRRRPSVGLEEAEELAGPNLESEVVANERLRQLFRDLGEITERQRGALVMRELSGLEYADIAHALSISPAAAKQTVFEAHSALHELAEGRALPCDGVRESLSADDRRLLRGRKLRAHLRHCDGCRSFQEGVTARRADLAALAPALPGGLAAALMQSFFGGGGGPDGGGGGGLLASAGGATAAAGGGSMATGGMTAATGGASAAAGGAVAGSSAGGGGMFSGGLLGAAAGGGAPAVATSAAAKIVLPVAVITVGAQSIGLPEEARREPSAIDRGGVSAPAEQRREGPRSPLRRALDEVGGRPSLLPASAGLLTGGTSGGLALEAPVTQDSIDAPPGALPEDAAVADGGAAAPVPSPDTAGPTPSTPDGATFQSDGSSEFLSEGPRGVPGPGTTPSSGSRPDDRPVPAGADAGPVEPPQAADPPRADSGPPVAYDAPQDRPDPGDPVDPTQGTAGGGGSGGPLVDPDLDTDPVPDPDTDLDPDPDSDPAPDSDADNGQAPDEPIETDPEPDVDPLPGQVTAP